MSSPSKWPPNTSCNIGEEMYSTPMPALTFNVSTPHSSQNCGVFQAVSRCTWRCVTIELAAAAGGVQPVGAQPSRGTR